MHWSEVWEGKSFRAHFARTTLTPLSWLYAGGWETYLAVYGLGLKRPEEPHRPVVCVGNLVAGGSGKSPAALYLASLLIAMGRRVVIGCSGYGSPHSESASVAPEGALDALEWGDEPAMIRWLMPEVPLIVGRDRVEAAKLCHSHFPDAVLLMDDGFQHLPLKKHLTILLDSATSNHRCLPAGPYREPLRNRKRGSLLVRSANSREMHGEFQLQTRLTGLMKPSGESVTFATQSRVSVLCALANPSRFLADLGATGIGVDSTKCLPDHDSLQMGNLFDGLNPNLPVVVTAKDWVKLQRRSDLGSKELLIARQEARIEPEADFKAWLAAKLDELP